MKCTKSTKNHGDDPQVAEADPSTITAVIPASLPPEHPTRGGGGLGTRPEGPGSCPVPGPRASCGNTASTPADYNIGRMFHRARLGRPVAMVMLLL